MDRARAHVLRVLSLAAVATACARPPETPERGLPMPPPSSHGWLDLGPAIAADAFPGGTCGGLAASPWEDHPTPILDGHMTMVARSGVRDLTPLPTRLGHRGMCSRSTFDVGGPAARMRIVAEELYRSPTRDFAAAIAALESGTKGARGRLDLPLPAVSVAPEPSAGAGPSGAFAEVLRVYVVAPDDTVQRISFSVSPPDLTQAGSGCAALARDVALTLRAGPRALDRRAGPRDLPRFRVTLPGDIVLADPCDDLREVALYLLRPLGAPSGKIRIVNQVDERADDWLGTTRVFHPPINEPWFDDVAGGRLRRRATWHLWPGGRKNLELPGSAVIIEADDADTLALLTRIAESAWDEWLAPLRRSKRR